MGAGLRVAVRQVSALMRLRSGSPAARQLALVNYPICPRRVGRARRSHCVGSAISPYWTAKLSPDRISKPIHGVEQELNNRTIFCSLQVLFMITTRKSATVDFVYLIWPLLRV